MPRSYGDGVSYWPIHGPANKIRKQVWVPKKNSRDGKSPLVLIDPVKSGPL